jgi:hypothetical protein
VAACENHVFGPSVCSALQLARTCTGQLLEVVGTPVNKPTPRHTSHKSQPFEGACCPVEAWNVGEPHPKGFESPEAKRLFSRTGLHSCETISVAGLTLELQVSVSCLSLLAKKFFTCDTKPFRCTAVWGVGYKPETLNLEPSKKGSVVKSSFERLVRDIMLL